MAEDPPPETPPVPGAANTKITVYQLTVGESDVDVGYIGDVEPSIELVLLPTKVQAMMEQELGDKVIGIKPSFKCVLQEITADNLALAFPWSDGDSIALAPETLGVDLYDYAVKCTLHPIDMGDDASQDYTFLKAVPIGHTRKSDGKTQDGIPMTWKVYPDRDQLPTIVLGYIGEEPTPLA